MNDIELLNVVDIFLLQESMSSPICRETVGKEKPPNYVMKFASLPPASSSTRHHSLRTYHQVQAWEGNVFQLNIWAGPSNRDNTCLSHTLYPLNQATCCISHVVGAKETASEIVSASEAG
ncbi:hypothetical protein PR048_019792 [Dryococelus australis]|uniref:Uncharacterized protein n=1 Tax=Dryococelus australis TaxID=614101 RepID=A0ABQ9H4Q2_9NEOP|nr:hypothetical protein PR048_019792 [Dryococelus australis]